MNQSNASRISVQVIDPALYVAKLDDGLLEDHHYINDENKATSNSNNK